MITVFVTFPLPEGTTAADAAAIFEGTAPRYSGLEGLVRKYYLYQGPTGDQPATGGGVYLWQTREAAEAAHGDTWRAFIGERYGTEPEVRFFDTAVIVDNEAGRIETGL